MHDVPEMPDLIASRPVQDGLIARPGAWLKISHLSDIEPHIRPDCGIRRFDDEAVSTIDYSYAAPDTFLTATDLECRGIIFHRRTGLLLSRPFHKFFNLGERESPANIDFTRPGHVEDKIDGTMLHALELDGTLRLATARGFTIHAAHAERAAPASVHAVAREAVKNGLTPVFEWASQANRNVIDYGAAEFTLLAVRDRTAGTYHPDIADDLARDHGLARPDHLATGIASAADLAGLAADLYGRTGIEGGVLVFPDGHRVKIKTFDYLRRHAILGSFSQERHVWSMILSGTLDDGIAVIGHDRADPVLKHENALNAALRNHAECLRSMAEECVALTGRDRARKIQTDLPKILQGPAFQVLKGEDAMRALRTAALRHAATAEGREVLRNELGFPTWVNPYASLNPGA